jgi:Ni/Co efflux regulator RcnB
MKALFRALTVSTLALTLAGGVAFAQDHPDQAQHQQHVQHKERKKGYHLNHDDWARGQAVSDWHAHHLRRPPDGYEWRMIDSNYVLANSDGVISTLVVVH